ncbi:MAG: glycosyltransferase family 39 protein [Selenomonadaceae bacterium]|nr:glycosyltransferase family 39 protein [Selenomonadaceae bacterium]
MVRILILLLVSVLLFFVGNNLLPFTDPVEGNYTQTAKEMLFSGDYFSPRIYGGYWYDKPVFFYWELIAAYKMFGINEFAARFFPALMATFGVFATYFFGRKLFDKSVGFIAAVILMTSLEY